MGEFKVCTFVFDGCVYEVYQRKQPEPEDYQCLVRDIQHMLLKEPAVIIFPNQYRVIRTDQLETTITPLTPKG